MVTASYFANKHCMHVSRVEYHYDIDLIECDDGQAVEKRKALYESYCDLVSYSTLLHA